jgi:hypothetical protein
VHHLSLDPRRLFSGQKVTWRGIVVLLVVAIAAGAAGAGTTFAVRRNLNALRAVQQRAFDRAQGRISSGDCATALPYLRLATSRHARPDLAASARAQLADCRSRSSWPGWCASRRTTCSP